MNKQFLKVGISVGCISLSMLAAAQSQDLEYREPTRGFLQEFGYSSGVGNASVEMTTSMEDSGIGGGVRLGMPNSELILDRSTDTDENTAILKWELPEFQLGDQAKLYWSVIGGLGLGHIEGDNDVEADYSEIALGVAATAEMGDFLLNIQPALIRYDVEKDNGAGNKTENDDTYFSLGIGAYYNLMDTQVGRFKVGSEINFSSADDDNGNESDDDTVFLIGARWIYNEHLTLDVVPLIFADQDKLSFPGSIRLNAAF
ncbi:hypothetical protein BTA51_05210 [Hahella sp. CCB-MM4]|uniref:hypothetical protein n=1 Tax=Hahella sp. (strain CCB-MM4) TaxID=1926491 RepID=UPI000B9AEA66|nr:hypothetical protein [Hahella sp. CCB-MM4]OZG74409.1 hypothetical protein BTA51_05210 [Hahella sp. CCB-MM4]